MSTATLACVQWLLARLMPSSQADALLGDLLEERRLRIHVDPTSGARWYWGQLAWSLPVLLWASWYRRSSFLTLGVAVVSCVAAGVVAVLIRDALSPMTTSDIGRTAPLLAMLVFLATSVMLANAAGTGSLWFEGSFLILGSLAPMAGAALSRRWRKAAQ